jgi:hypothetical protein
MFILGQTINTRNTNGSNIGYAKRKVKKGQNTHEAQIRK